jgi:uncharacterized protein
MTADPIFYAGAADGVRVVLAHGAGAGQRHPFIVNVARRLAAAGLNVATFDFPYMEQRRRVPDPASVLEHRFRQVIEQVRTADGGSRRLFIGGKSMGGRIATQLAAQGEAVKGVFALGYPLHPPGKPLQLRSAHLPKITVPVLIVQGERDPFGTPSELEPVIGTMGAPVRLQIVASGDHSLGAKGVSPNQLHDWLASVIVEWIGVGHSV